MDKSLLKSIAGTLLAMALLLGFVAVCGSLGGCAQWTDPITPVPRQVQEKTGAPAQVPLSKVPEITSEYQDAVAAEARKKTADNAAWKKSRARQLRDLAEAIEQEGQEREADAQALLDSASAALGRFEASAKLSRDKAEAFAGKLWGVFDVGKSIAENSGIPLAPWIIGALGTIGGIFIPRPGEKKKTDTAYDQGVNAGLLMDRSRVPAVHPTPDLLPSVPRVVAPAAEA